MPELPEVETMCRGIRPVVGSTIVAAERVDSPRRPIVIYPAIAKLDKRLRRQQITDISRAGKRVVLHISTGDKLVFEPRMTGLVLIGQPPTAEHARFRMQLRGRSVKQLIFWDRRGLGRIHLLTDLEFQREILEKKLGPDALAISESEFRERLKCRSTPIKVALLNQSILAGVGNLYASELLHLAKVHPAKRCNRISQKLYHAIFTAMGKVLREAIRFEGSTLSDGTYRNALNQSGTYQTHHRVYDRTDLPCPICKTSRIKRIVQSQRATFYCPNCQK